MSTAKLPDIRLVGEKQAPPAEDLFRLDPRSLSSADALFRRLMRKPQFNMERLKTYAQNMAKELANSPEKGGITDLTIYLLDYGKPYVQQLEKIGCITNGRPISESEILTALFESVDLRDGSIVDYFSLTESERGYKYKDVLPEMVEKKLDLPSYHGDSTNGLVGDFETWNIADTSKLPDIIRIPTDMYNERERKDAARARRPSRQNGIMFLGGTVPPPDARVRRRIIAQGIGRPGAVLSPYNQAFLFGFFQSLCGNLEVIYEGMYAREAEEEEMLKQIAKVVKREKV